MLSNESSERLLAIISEIDDASSFVELGHIISRTAEYVECASAYLQKLQKAYKRLENVDDVACANLTPRQKETLIWIARGKSYSEAAQIMGVSKHTVDYHMRNVYKKLEVNANTLAALKAHQSGLLSFAQ